ncbi:DNA polymerase III subunit beta [Bacillus salitolerans]|uniref:Beta sliding clamp n=1 Tax=Bacillus salitolerans TaxID=1437434 RepID=A0ABW4LM58_9BACI
MKFTIDPHVINEGLQKVSKVVSAKVTIPILQGILLDVSNEEIVLTGSDGTETVQYCIPVDGEAVDVVEPGKIVITKQTVEILKKAKKVIHFTTNELSLNVKFARSDFDLNCLDGEEYPKFPVIDLRNPNITLKGEEFSDFVRKTAFAASTSETRPILTGILLNVEDGKSTLVCTDSHRLARISQTCDSDEKFKIVIPAKSLNNAQKVFNMENDVKLYGTETQILLKCGNILFLSRLLEGNYPDTARLIPTEHKSKMTINRKELLDGLEILKELSNSIESTTSGVVKMHINGVCSLSSYQDQRGKGKNDIEYSSYEGEEDFTISFSVKYALEALKSMEAAEVDFLFSGDMRPFLIAPTSTEQVLDELQLILPVRTY